ncbi:MAG: DUF1957 domain-containing protein [Treponema sp.]|nr:DUF1957 domain-containing protein [Treponema sp.]
MECRYVISLVLNAHLPFVREFNGDDDLSQAGEEGWFFNALSETYIPLLLMLDRLENDRIPFRLGLSISPLFCQMLGDEHLKKKYLAHIDRQIEFGRSELERNADKGELHKLAELFFNRTVDRKTAFIENYESNILGAIDRYKRKGKIEILASPATHAFLPFQTSSSGAIYAQIETAISCYKQHFGGCPQGFWLPELGWSTAVEPYLRKYNFSYTIVDAHGLIFGKPAPLRGSFYPVKTPGGIFVLGRDFYAARDLEQMAGDGIYRDNTRDAGYELPPCDISPFLSTEGSRHMTGFKYWQLLARQAQDAVYDPDAARDRAVEHARIFLEDRIARLDEAAKHIGKIPISLCAYNADSFGHFWHEGPLFIEALFRLASSYRGLQFMTPVEYLYKQDTGAFQTSVPEFSSWGFNGYAETWLDASNDWMYRHLIRSMERMTELAERFPDDTGLKERALNQAAREILLAQCSDWPKLLYNQDSTEYARNKIEGSLRNFTTIYEALGSNYISTEWLTSLERRHNVFPDINYRIFRRRK